MADAPPHKLLSDTAYSYGAFALMALTGALLNLFIAAGWGAAALGVFNQVYAAFVVLAQLAAFGLHDSTQRHVAEHIDHPDELRPLIGSALQLVTISGGLSAAVLWLASDWIGQLTDSPGVGEGLRWIVPGLGLFAINKVLLAVLNGQRRIRALALGQSLRFVVLGASVLAIGVLDRPSVQLCAGFSIAEVALLPVLLIGIRPPLRGSASWRARHLAFGAHALPNGLLAESYLRVDVLMLSLFVDDAQVGTYSFATMFAEGLYQVGATIRTVVNPALVVPLIAGDRAKIRSLSRTAMALGLAAFVPVAGGVLLLLPWLAPWLGEELVTGAHEILWILSGGLLVYAAFVPVDHALLQAGLPGRQSGLMALNICLNAALNLALIPGLGIEGAAFATATAWALSAITLNLAVWRWLGLPWGLLGIR
ncbi:MAG TPA: hypothetical protein ENK18_16230 [Deltaproteobacteria bacterium]|nr:hypothetical protein [Deltaproteobacteria bacterium]